MTPRRKFLLAFFMITSLSVGLSGCANNVSAIEPNKTIVELEMGPVRGPVLTKLTATKRDTLRLILPVDNPPDIERPPPWDITIRTPSGRWYAVINFEYDIRSLSFHFKEFVSLPYIDISIADIEGLLFPLDYFEESVEGDHNHYIEEKIFQEPGKYRIRLEENVTRHIEGYESLEGQVILK